MSERSGLPSLTVDTLAAQAERMGEEIAVGFRGSADLTTQEQLRQFLEELHGAALRDHARQVIVDFAQLEFMNSSCFKAFLTWINEVQKLDTPARYHVTFRSNENMHWQKRSLHALRCFAADLITIQPARQPTQ